MTDDEVQLIYDYLHENYRYEEGEFISVKQTKGKRLGEKLGHLNTRSDYPSMKASINVNGKNFTKPLASFVYLFFNKIFHANLEFIDENIVNTRIENIKIKEMSCSASLKRKNKGFLEETRNGRQIYRCLVSLKGKKISLGYYDSKEECININKTAKELLGNHIMTINEIKESAKKIHDNAKIRLKTKCLPGVYKRGNKFRAAIFHNKKKINIGTYEKEKEAHAAYLKAKEDYKLREIQPAPFLGNLSAEQIQRTVDSVSNKQL